MPLSHGSSIGARVHAMREFFVLKDTEALSARLAADARGSVVRDVTIARQKREAAEVLWLGGGPAEALALARDALEHITRAVQRAHEQGAAPPLPQSAVDVAANVARKPLPALDTEVEPEHTEIFFAAINAHDELRSLVEPATFTQPEVARRRLTRAAAAVAVAGVVIAAIVLATRTPRSLKATASANYDESHGAALSVDGRDATEWLLPNKQTGFLDITVHPARKLARLKVLNGHNPPYNDRQTKDYQVELFGAGGKVLKAIDGTFGEFNNAPGAVTIPLDTSEKVERIRFHVKSFHKDGSALAEVEVD